MNKHALEEDAAKHSRTCSGTASSVICNSLYTSTGMHAPREPFVKHRKLSNPTQDSENIPNSVRATTWTVNMQC